MTNLSSRWVDCSSNNEVDYGEIDIAAYANAGHKWLARKVSEGIGYHWVNGDTIADQAHSHGLHDIHYHWLRPDSNPVAQAQYFVTLLSGHTKAGDKVMTDFERSPVADPKDLIRADQLHDFNTRVRQLRPDLPLLVYTGNWYLDGRPAMQAECRKWDIVISDYSGNPLKNPYNLHYVARQFTDNARVAGFPGPVDYNMWLTVPQEDEMTPAQEQLLQQVADGVADIQRLAHITLTGRSDDPSTPANEHVDGISQVMSSLDEVKTLLKGSAS